MASSVAIPTNYYPELVYDNHGVEPEKTPEEGYHLTEDLTDKAIQFIADAKQVAPNKPFFMYFCPGAAHAPHHVPKEWADKYKGQFDDGWDAYREKTFKRQKELGLIPKDAELSRHDPDVQDWNTLSAGEKTLYARMMEVFAGFVSHTDYHYGRLFQFLKDLGEFDNTIIMFISDNGASSEGGPSGSVQREQVLQQRARLARAEPGDDRRAGRSEYVQPLRVGLDVCRQYAVPALEARDLSRRHQRSVHRPLAEGHQGQGRGAHAVRARHRHGADRARGARHRGAGVGQGRDAVADRRPSALRMRSTRATRPRSTLPSTSR